eukprot:8796358-Pyramimonas_sp.AAC.1
MPPISASQRDANLQRATGGLRAGAAPTLPLHRPGRAGQQAIAVNALCALFSSGASSLEALR